MGGQDGPTQALLPALQLVPLAVAIVMGPRLSRA